ncbi:MAG: ABC transporter ATP-binding protein [Oceanococcaceae bacterium]
MTLSSARDAEPLVRIEGMTKSYHTPGFKRLKIFDDLSLVLPMGRNIGVLGPNGAGKSTLLRLIGGIEKPDRGRIRVRGRPSPPKGLSGGVVPVLTGRDNARFVCRLCGLNKAETHDRLGFIAGLASLGMHFDRPVNTYSNGMRARLNFAINMAFEYDVYLFDELGAVGDKIYRDRASAVIEQRKQSSSFIIVSHIVQQLRKDCDAGLYLAPGGEAVFYESLDEAIARYEADPPAAQPAAA